MRGELNPRAVRNFIFVDFPLWTKILRNIRACRFCIVPDIQRSLGGLKAIQMIRINDRDSINLAAEACPKAEIAE
jgi:hypothetical protein